MTLFKFLKKIPVYNSLNYFGTAQKYIIEKLKAKREDLQKIKAPGPRGTPISGNLWAFYKNVFNLFENGFKNYGDIVRFRVVTKIFHLLAHPKDIHYVLKDNDQKFSRSKSQSSILLRSITGPSLLTLEGDEWITRKKLTGPAFSKNAIKSYVNIMNTTIDEVIHSWSIDNDHVVFDVSSQMSAITAEIAGRTFFGTTGIWNPTELEKSVQCVLQHHWHRVKSVFDLVHILPTKSRRKYDQGMKYIQEIVKNIKNEKNKGQFLLNKLVEAKEDKEVLSETNIKNEIITFLLAGHETTATALIWSLYTLAIEPNWQNTIYEEIQNKKSENLTTESIDEFVYIDYFFNEILRLHPPVWLLERQTIEDCEIGSYFIPKNTSLLMAPLITHRHPEFWEEPDKFDPFRFKKDSIIKSKMAFFPFGLGQHTCIGQIFATYECKLILLKLIKNFSISLHDKNFKPIYEVGITLRMKNPLKIQFNKRQQ